MANIPFANNYQEVFFMNERRLGFDLNRTARQIRRYIDRDTSKIYDQKMTATHARAIGFFFHNSHRDIFQKDFEREFGIRRSTASNILALMEENELIKRESVSHDARLKKITLTQKAIDLHKVVIGALDSMEDTIKQGITDQELQVFYTVLEKIKSNLERTDECNDKTAE